MFCNKLIGAPYLKHLIAPLQISERLARGQKNLWREYWLPDRPVDCKGDTDEWKRNYCISITNKNPTGYTGPRTFVHVFNEMTLSLSGWVLTKCRGTRSMSWQPMNNYKLYHVHSTWILAVWLVQALEKCLNCLSKWMLSAHASLGFEVEKGHGNCVAWWHLNLPFHHLRNKKKPIAFFVYCNCVSNRSAIKTIAIKTG